MAGTGDTLAFPDGSDYTITASAGETGGSLALMHRTEGSRASRTSSLMTLARLYEKYEETIVPAKRGQRAVMGPFARVGRRK